MKFSGQKIDFSKLIGAILVVFAAFSCSLQREKTLLEKNAEGKYEIPPDTLISIKEDNYLGQYYTLVISADGNAVLTPTQFGGYGEPKVPQNIPIKTRLTQENLAEIISKFEETNFFSLRDKYRMGDAECPNRMTDGSAQTFSIRIGGKQKSVYWENCYNDQKMVPQQLHEIEEKIQESVDLKQVSPY